MLEARHIQAAAWMIWIQRSICIDVTSIKVLSAVWCGGVAKTNDAAKVAVRIEPQGSANLITVNLFIVTF